MSAELKAQAPFFGLDAMRGIAAVCVIVRHSSGFVHGPALFSAFMAVDFFFQLSGFVLAHAYEQRFARDLDLPRFMRVRTVRLYPLYLLGTMLGCIAVTVLVLSGRAMSLYHYGLGIRADATNVPNMPFAAIALPAPFPIFRGVNPLFPFNCPAWSLFFELLVNAVYRVLYPQLSDRVLTLVVGVSGIALFLMTVHANGLNYGGNWHELSFGAVRVAFSFFLGVLLYRKRGNWQLPRSLSLLPLVALFFAMIVTVPTAWTMTYELVAIMGVFPVVLLAGSKAHFNGRLKQGCRLVGRTSYAMYIMHMPLILLFVALTPIAWLGILSKHGLLVEIVFALGLLMLCDALDRYFDAPLRARLMSMRTRRAVP